MSPHELPERLTYLLLQVRGLDDPMRLHEVSCFARVLGCEESRIRVLDLLRARPTHDQLGAVDVVLLGGSGDYSVAEGGPWLESALDAMRDLAELSKPTFASCWGFQGMARALGGEVVTDLERAEVGTMDVRLTEAGEADPVFGPLGGVFPAQSGHQDIVERLPHGAVHLASSARVAHQAFTLPGKPIYCTQFHPELRKSDLLDRLRTYPKYVKSIAGVPFNEFEKSCRDSVDTEELLLRFIRLVFGE